MTEDNNKSNRANTHFLNENALNSGFFLNFVFC